MTKEEVEKRAEESLGKRPGTYGYNNFSICAKPYKDGFLDGYFIGAKENAPQWHDLRKNREGFPDKGRVVLCWSGRAYFLARHGADDWRMVGCGAAMDAACKVSAWCEIPKFGRKYDF